MNAAEKKLLEYIEECNKIDYEQIERFSWEIRADIEKIRFLIDIVKKQEERLEELSSLRLMMEFYKEKAQKLEEKLIEEEENHIPGI